MKRWTLSVIFRPEHPSDLLVLAEVMSPANGLAVGEMNAAGIRLYSTAQPAATGGALPFIEELLDGNQDLVLPNGCHVACSFPAVAAGLKHVMGPDGKPFVGLARMSDDGLSVLEQPAGGTTSAGLAAACGNPQPPGSAAPAQMQSAVSPAASNVVPLRPSQTMTPRTLPTLTPAPAVPFPRTSTYYAPQNVYFPDKPLSESYALMTGPALANGEIKLILVPLTGSGVPALEIGSFDPAKNLIKAAQWGSHANIPGGTPVAPLPPDMLAPGNPRKYPRPLDSRGKPCADTRNNGGHALTFYNIVGCALCEAYGWEMDTKGDDDCQDYPLTQALGTPVFSLAWQDQASYEAGIAAFETQRPAMEAAMMNETLGIMSSIAGGPVDIQFVDQNGNVTASYGAPAASQTNNVVPVQGSAQPPQPLSTARPTPQVTTLGQTVPPFDQNALGLLIQPDGSARPPASMHATLALGLVKHPRYPRLEAIVLAPANDANLPTIQIGDWDPSTQSGVLDFTAATIPAGTALSPLTTTPSQLRIVHQGPISTFDEIPYHIIDSLGQAIGCTVDLLQHDVNASAILKAPAFSLVCRDAAGIRQTASSAPAGGGSRRAADEPLPPLPDAMKDLATAVKANPALLKKLDPKLAATLKAHTGFDDREAKLKKIDDASFKPILGGGWS